MDYDYHNSSPEYIERNLELLRIVPYVPCLWFNAILTLVGEQGREWDYCIPEEVISGGVDRKN